MPRSGVCEGKGVCLFNPSVKSSALLNLNRSVKIFKLLKANLLVKIVKLWKLTKNLVKINLNVIKIFNVYVSFSIWKG